MHLRVVLVTALACSSAFLTAAPQPVQATRQKAPTLTERFPPPPGYGVEQDVESDSMRSFSTATDVRGHIIRRYVQAGDDGPTSVPDIARYFADLLHAQGGFLFDDRVNNRAGRLDGRIPGLRPVWLHVEINDDGSALDITALEESAASARDMPLEDTGVAGTWAATEALADMAAADRPGALKARDALSALAAPLFRPLQGWAWQLTAEVLSDGSAATTATSPYRVRLAGLQRSQACATCPALTDTQKVTAFTMDVNRVESLGDIVQDTVRSEGFFLNPGFMSSAEVTRFKEGGRVLVTRPGRPALFVPVTRETYLEARIRYAQGANGNVDELRKELATLSADDRSAPAGDSLGRPIARLNPAYFEAGRDRAAPHFIVIDIPWKYGIDEVSLYQRDLVDGFLANAKLTDLVK